MKFLQLLAQKEVQIHQTKIPTIAFLGDSVTQGCFEIYRTETGLETVYDRNCAYHTYLTKMLAMLCPGAPLTVINAGISGDNAKGGLARLERDVLSHQPDLCVVCFGLNDNGAGLAGVTAYGECLEQIFSRLQEAGCEVIYLTPNMMCTAVTPQIRTQGFGALAETIAQRQNEGVLDAYLAEGKAVANACGVKVCDVYAKWKRMAACGINTSALLANYVNHPTREMNYLFASSLLDTLLED